MPSLTLCCDLRRSSFEASLCPTTHVALYYLPSTHPLSVKNAVAVSPYRHTAGVAIANPRFPAQSTEPCSNAFTLWFFGQATQRLCVCLCVWAPGFERSALVVRTRHGCCS